MHGLGIQTSSSLVSRNHGRVAEWIKNWITVTNCFHNEWVWLPNLLILEISRRLGTQGEATLEVYQQQTTAGVGGSRWRGGDFRINNLSFQNML